MVNLIYGIDIKGKFFKGVEINTDLNFIRTIDSDIGLIHLPYTYNIYETIEERNMSIFTNNKNKLSISEVIVKYNITKEEAIEAYESAVAKFPEKFI